jgi:hypothetical protein
MAESIKTLTEVMEGFGEGSHDISDEDYDALIASGMDESMFAKTIDGYRYLGETSEAVGDISEAIRQKFLEAENDFDDMIYASNQAKINM